jgi:hypothetical protein
MKRQRRSRRPFRFRGRANRRGRNAARLVASCWRWQMYWDTRAVVVADYEADRRTGSPYGQHVIVTMLTPYETRGA